MFHWVKALNKTDDLSPILRTLIKGTGCSAKHLYSQHYYIEMGGEDRRIGQKVS